MPSPANGGQPATEPTTDADAAMRRLARLPESRMRVAGVHAALAAGATSDAVALLEAMTRGALIKDRDGLTVYECLLDPWPYFSRLDAARLDALTQEAFAVQALAAHVWLSSRSLAAPTATRRTDTPNAPNASQRLVHWQLRDMTLGARRSLARHARGDRLKQLLVDPDPGVVRNLLNNPRTTETTVLALCSHRPTVSAPLETVLRSRRWVHRYAVKRALVLNPYLQPMYAVTLLPCLNRPDLVAIRDDATLAGAVRGAAERLLALLREAS